MVLTEKAFKAVKYIAYTLEAAFLVVFVILCIAIAKKNATIKEYKEAMKYQSEIVDSLNQSVKDLWGMDCIKVDVICNIQQKGVVNVQQSTQVAKSVATYTRGEVLMALDSLKRANNVTDTE